MLRSSRIDVLDEELRLAAHREPQVVLEIGKPRLVARHRLERAELQPLSAEVLRQGADLGVAQHPPYLRREDLRVAQRAGVRRAPQLGVGHTGPQEVRQPRRELVLADRVAT